MRQLSFIALLGTLTILIGGCGGGETETATSPTPAATTPATEATPQQSPTQPFSSPMVDPKQTPKPTPGATKPQPTPTIIVTAPPELTPPTDPNQRTAQVQKEIDQANRDPFGVTALELNPEQPNQNNNRTPAQKPNRAIPTISGVPAAQPPVVTIPNTTATPNARNVPTVVGVPSAQAPMVVIPRRATPQQRTRNGTTTTPNRTVPQAPIASVPASPGISTRTRPQVRVRINRTQAPRTPQSSRNVLIVRTPQSTQRRSVIVARPSQQTQRPAVRTAQRPQRTQTPNRTVARTPQRTQTPNRTVAAAPTSPPTPAIVAPPAPPEIPTLPPPPDPILAKAVEVSGVVVVGTEPQAIIKAPNEANSRYVRTGQRLANGQVLVKRIEFNEGSEPIVILEQNGVEVAKVVGERPPTAPTAPAAPAQSGAQAVISTPATGKRQANV